MFSLSRASRSKPGRSRLDELANDPTEARLVRLVLRIGARTGELIRYLRALHQLRRLDDRDLDDLDLARADFPELAYRHAIGAEPVARLRR